MELNRGQRDAAAAVISRRCRCQEASSREICISGVLLSTHISIQL
jgi:hypothetical protein